MSDFSQPGSSITMGAEPRSRLPLLLIGPYRLFHSNRHLAQLTLSYALAMLGEWLFIVTLTVVAFLISRSATTVALLTFVRLLPYAMGAPLVGTLIDRWDRKTLVTVAHAGRVVCLLGLALVHSPATLPLAFPLVFLEATLSNVVRPAVSSILPAMVAGGAIEQANSVMSQMDSLADVVGPALTSLLVLLGHAQLSFVVAAAAFAGAAALLYRADVRPCEASPHPDDEGWLTQAGAGFRFLLRENERVLAAFILPIVGIFVTNGAWWSLIVIMSVQVFHLGGQGAGFFESIYAVGGVLAAFVAGSLIRRLQFRRLFILGITMSALFTALFGLSPAGIWPFVCVGILGIGDSLLQVNGTTVIQAATPGDLQGRVFSAFEAIMVCAQSLGALIVGSILAVASPRAATVAFAAVTAALLALCLPRLLRLESVLGIRIFLHAVPIFASLSRRALDDLGGRLRVEHYPPLTEVVRAGEHGDRLYIVKSGELEVIAYGERAQSVVVNTLTAMDYFGEIALLRGELRTATVRSRGRVELYSLNRSDFHDLLRSSAELRQAVMETSEARYKRTEHMLIPRR
jgi:MFS family permease